MSVDFVKPDQAPNLNVLAYGPPGSGKTTGGCSGPGPVLVLEAEPGNPLRYARERFGDDKIREVSLAGANVLDDVYLYLRDKRQGEETVVLDSVGEAFRVVLEELAGGGKPTLPNYGDATTKVERFCRSLIALPINVVLIAHETTVKDEEAGHFERLPVTGTSNPALGTKLMAMVDVVAYCGIDEKPDGVPDRYMAQLVSANGRRGKDRTNTLGKSSEFDVSAWVDLASPKSNAKTTTNRRAVAA